MNAIKYGLVRQGNKLFILFTNKIQQEGKCKHHILKSQTELNVHEKISENFKKIPLEALKNLTTYWELQCTFCFYASEEYLLFKASTISEGVSYSIAERLGSDISTEE